MIDVTVKTLDSQNHVFNVEEEISVKQFKEIISPTIGIPIDQQRLIFRGRVLQDDKKISEYSVANSVVHVVQRPSNQNSTANDEPPRPGSQVGNRMNDGGLMFGADDGMGGGGRNAIIMGAIGLPQFDIEGNPVDEGGQPAPRRSGAAVRLMVGNQMLNRASNLLQQLEDDDAVLAATSAAADSVEQNSPDNEYAADNDSPMEIDDDPASIERMISQVVHVSSAAALVAAIRPMQAQAGGGMPQTSQTNSSGQPLSNIPAPVSTPAPVPATGAVSNSGSAAESQNGSQPSPARRPESPRLRELATALQDLLALQDRLNPFLRFLQDSLRQNRQYAETGESLSTQFVYDTLSSIMHLLSHSLHAFSDIMCDFSINPEQRRLTASSSILVEQSTVVRAAIPVAIPHGAMLAAAGAGGGGNNNSPQFSFSFGPGQPPIGIGVPQWRNPNLTTNNTNNGTVPTTPTIFTPPTNPPQQPPPAQNQQNGAGIGIPGMAIPGLNFQAGMLPPGLQNLGALLGMAAPGGMPGMVNIFGAGGAPVPPQGGPVPTPNVRPSATPAENQQQASASVTATSGGPTAPAPASGNGTPRPPQQGQGTNSSGAENPSNANNNNGGMFHNFQQLRNELNRPQFDVLLPCHTHHSSSRSRSNRARPAEFRRFVNVDSNEGTGSTNQGTGDAETVEVLMDVIRHSSLLNLLQPVVKDVVLNYLMRGRDPKNEAHVNTCAKGLAKKILPFFEKFSSKIPSKNETVDISATYTNILTHFIAALMQKVLGQTPGGDGQFKMELINSFMSLQKQLIQTFKVCYPSTSNIGLLFVNYVIEHCLGGMSIIFKGHVRHTLVEHMKVVEKTSDSSTIISVMVYKTAEAPSTAQNASPSTSSTAPTVVASSPTAPISSRCAAAFGGASTGTEASSTSTPPTVTKEIPLHSTSATDDVDIDEVLQLPPSMAESSGATSPVQNPPRRGGGSATGHANQTDSIVSLMRGLPGEWIDTIQQDIRRQVEMPTQPTFSPGYNTLFPKKQ